MEEVIHAYSNLPVVRTKDFRVIVSLTQKLYFPSSFADVSLRTAKYVQYLLTREFRWCALGMVGGLFAKRNAGLSVG